MTGPFDRRQFLLAGGACAGAVLLGGCSGGDPRPTGDQPPVTRADRLEGDLAVATLLVSLENLLVAVYQEALDRRERLGPYPPAVQAFVEGAQRRHREHAKAWNGILTGAGKRGVTGLNLPVKASTSDPAFNRARDYSVVLQMFQEVESVTATTYLHAIGALDNNAAVKVAASVHPIENEHVGTLAFLLGRNIPGEGFGRTDGARPTSDSIG